MSQFEYLKRYDPKGGRAWYTLPILGSPRLQVRHAGGTNKGYVNAVAKHNAKTGTARRIARGQVDADLLHENLQVDRQLFPKYVIVGWDGVRSTDGDLVPFSQESCRDLLDALPDWIIQELSTFAAVAANFLPDDVPSEDDVDEQAGN